MNRRTADVVSRGFSNLFVLQKDDLETVLKDYPDAKRILNARARRLMKENEERFAKEVYEQKLHEEAERRRQKQEGLADVSSAFCDGPSLGYRVGLLDFSTPQLLDLENEK